MTTAREQYAEVLAGMWRPAALALREHEPLAGLPLMCGCGHSAGTKYQREKHVAQAVADALAADLPDPEQDDDSGSTCPGCTGDPADHPSDHHRSGPDPEQAVREALDEVERLLCSALGERDPGGPHGMHAIVSAVRDRRTGSEARP